MKVSCPNINNSQCSTGTKIVLDGTFFRPSDGRKVQRYRCKNCGKRFSSATFHPAFGQNKRRVNFKLKQLLCSGVSLRRSAIILKVNRKTVERKLRYLAQRARLEHQKYLESLKLVKTVQFDDLVTIEHTKCKPLSVTLAVESPGRRILGFKVSQAPATGHLAAISRKKYGYRKDHRPVGIKNLFSEIQKVIAPDALIKSDQHPFYPKPVKKFFPDAVHETVKGARGCIAGQGELKKLNYDPLFSLNHTCAMLRANINRLIRKTWCTTKLPERLADHLAIYVRYHNARIDQLSLN